MADASNNNSSSMSGGQSAQDSAPRLDQPVDAVAMTSMAQTSTTAESEPATSAAPAGTTTTTTPAVAKPLSSPQEDAIEPRTDNQTTSAPAKPTLDHQDSLAIGPSVDHVGPVDPSQPSDGPVCNITLLLTTGARHPYRLDSRYLAKRNVTAPGTTEVAGEQKPDPFSISVYTLKELILREWRDEWETKPASPSSIRLIHFGKLLDDKDPLSQYHFSAEAANVVHMTVRPADIVEEEEPKGGGKSSSSGRGRSGGGGCCVIL